MTHALARQSNPAVAGLPTGSPRHPPRDRPRFRPARTGLSLFAGVRPPPAWNPPARRGFTLIEMLIVLAILGTMVAFSWPAMTRMLRRSGLADAAGKVRAELGRARLEAIESGTARQFRFEPGGRRFEIAPRAVSVGSDRELFGRFGSAADEGQSPQAAADEPPADEVTAGELDEGVYFAMDALGRPNAADALVAEENSLQGWSAPIVFYPNGRTLNAHFLLTDGRDYYVEITLRGLTGASRVSPVTVLPREETGWEDLP